METSSNHYPKCLSKAPIVDAIVREERWMATLAHELRDALSAMLLSLDELHSACADNPEAQTTQRIAKESGLHMASVIDDILNLYGAHCGNLTPYAEGITPEPERTELSRIVMASVRNSHIWIAKRGHQLSVSLPMQNLIIKGRSSRVQQILTNLLVNAAKYTETGGDIALNIQRSANTLVISVRDNGVGMSPVFVAQIFANHWKGIPRSPGERNGLGIGLALVKSLAELDGGTVVVESDGLGKGSEVIVRLPNYIAVELESRSMPLLGMDEIPDINPSNEAIPIAE
jgi:signal transduction histidine kinase